MESRLDLEDGSERSERVTLTAGISVEVKETGTESRLSYSYEVLYHATMVPCYQDAL
jgi:hypothetical protein